MKTIKTWLGSLILLLFWGCSAPPDRRGGLLDQKPVVQQSISEEMAITLAGNEAKRNGWKEFEVKGVRKLEESGNWRIFLVRIPKAPGGDAAAVITPNGEIVHWYPGM
jgi:hypothetical protein